jgi:DNA-binding NtrC family response regulator
MSESVHDGPAPSTPGRLRVLCLDDQESIRAILEKSLTRAGHDVVVTDSWPTVSMELVRNPPDVVILDLNMPALPGERVAPIVRRYAPNACLVLFSGEDEERLRSAREQSHADYVFHKGEIFALVATLQGIAQERRLRPVNKAG